MGGAGKLPSPTEVMKDSLAAAALDVVAVHVPAEA